MRVEVFEVGYNRYRLVKQVLFWWVEVKDAVTYRKLEEAQAALEQYKKDYKGMDLELSSKLIRNIAFGASAAVLLTIGGCGSFYTVDEGERAVHLRTGAFVGVQGPGLKFKFPIIDDVKKIGIREVPIKWEYDGVAKTDSRMATYSKDQQPAHVAVTVTWSIPGDEAAIKEIYSEYGSREGLYRAVILPKAVEAVKNIFGTYDAVTVIQQRERFNLEVSEAITRITTGYPVVISGVQIQDIEFSDSYEKAVEDRMKAQVEVQRMEQQKQTSQLQADMRVIQAEAQAKEILLKGEAEAQAIRARAEALASNSKLVELIAAERWDGKLPTSMPPNSTVPFLTVK